ncbi:MAG: helix-turn-helix domain-containing protein [Bacteroidales bacterium]|nr:helix-turn-helix domain-containing protein [Candidatus Cryptobacteroides caccocaballi]
MKNVVCYERVAIPDGCSFLARYDQEATIETLELHAHPEYEFQFTFSGYGIRTIGDVSEPFKEMEVLLIPGGMPHNWVYKNPENVRIQEYSVQFPIEIVTSVLAAFPEMKGVVSYFNALEHAVEIRGEEAARISSLMIAMVSMDPEERLLSLLEMLVAAYKCWDKRNISHDFMIRDEESSFEKIQKVLGYMEEHMSESLSLDKVADVFCMSKTAFCNFFKRKAGKTFIFALNEMRINRSCMMLTGNPEMSIAQIAYSVGYSSPAHFSRIFKHFRGTSPNNYRVRLQR